MDEVTGLTLLPAAISVSYETRLTDWLQTLDLEPVRGERRMVVQFGARYDYAQRTVVMDSANRQFPTAEMQELTSLLEERFQLPPGYFNQCILNRYLPGQGIAVHTDHPAFGDTIVCLTLGGARTMEFSRDGRTVTVPLASRDVYVMQDAARHHWKHAMPAHRPDAPPCWSVTLRHV